MASKKPTTTTQPTKKKSTPVSKEHCHTYSSDISEIKVEEQPKVKKSTDIKLQ